MCVYMYVGEREREEGEERERESMRDTAVRGHPVCAFSFPTNGTGLFIQNTNDIITRFTR